MNWVDFAIGFVSGALSLLVALVIIGAYSYKRLRRKVYARFEKEISEFLKQLEQAKSE